ncbi:hypothetical protein KC360_g6953 [Hortaea werneckii]|nr:hypothetical protein KC325_g7174 [Hortaea werneckii]KAI6988770.1 hypothetical protein KC359_g7587 [Hortaea werneckii]KAI7142527.1 hypothetical protein KC344_g7116 [Hortaea werneckii]KAI7170248.1 hypothetical protein KC360_g6953 [Hortaea werneckii]
MCMKASCGTCHKATWWGCGEHIPKVLDSVPEADRCSCEPKIEKEGKQYPPAGPAFGVVKNMFGMGGGAKEDGKEEL